MESYAGPDFGDTAAAAPRKAVARRVFEAARAPARHKLKLRQEMAYLQH